MAFSITIDLEQATGGYGTYFRNTPIFFSEIFTGLPQYPLGSTVRIQEILRIYTDIVDPTIVDVDTRYYLKKSYLGNWMIIDEIGIPLHAEGDDGFLSWEIQEIKRYSEYTVVHHPSTPKGEGSPFIVEQCNFFLKPSIYLPQPASTPITGFDAIDKAPLFRGMTELSPPPLINTKFFQRIHGIGLHFFPGVAGNRLEYSITAINNIAVDLIPTQTISCGLGQNTCSNEFSEFFSDNPSFYATEALCLADGPTGNGPLGAGCNFIGEYECSSDPTQKIGYWAGAGT